VTGLSRRARAVAACAALAACTTPERAPPPGPSPDRPAAASADVPSTLAALTRDPTARPARVVQTGRDTAGLAVSAYTYDLPDVNGPVLLDVLERDHAAWIVVLAPPSGGIASFAPPGGVASRIEARTGARWAEITSGPLAGAFVEQKKGVASVELKSVAWILAHDDHEIGGWLCHEGRIPGVIPKKPVELETACQAAVKGKLTYDKGLVFSPGLSGPHEIRTFANCTQAWNGWAESDTPWGRYKRSFSCTYDPRKGRLLATVAGP
jgi:hypothetical protein